MKKYFFQILFLFTSFICSANADMEWDGKCYIKYDGKIIVNNETCSMRQEVYSSFPSMKNHINETDIFSIVAVKNVDCDDNSTDCAYYFYANKHSVSGKILYQINYNIKKEVQRYPANLGEDFKINTYNPNDSEDGLCFLKENDMFCFTYIHVKN